MCILFVGLPDHRGLRCNRPAGLILEKLITDRSGEKGDRDLLVALALSLLEPRLQMPDPTPHRSLVADLLAELEGMERDR
ncbi:MAG: hypothetical protein ABSG17_23535 [Spirochaetia bacterium]